MEFRLLVEAVDPHCQPSFLLAGRYWTLSPPLDLEHGSTLPHFACISYLWGSEREPHALAKALTMSTHTCPSLIAAIRTSSCEAFWTDVFCVPHTGAARHSTLENMGYIYSRATEVIIVLGENTFSAIDELKHQQFFSEAALQTIECDEWVSSVWTYQEIINAARVYFVSERQTETFASIDCADFCNALGYGLSKWKKSASPEKLPVSKTFPRLDALETIFGDWLNNGAYTYHSALSVFTSIIVKRNADPANYFYAILGVLTDSPQQLIWDPNQNLAEKVMAICERKNDFSFVYTCEARDTDPQRCWYPRATSLPTNGATLPNFLRPILTAHCWGDAQNGHYDDEGFWLHGMKVMQPASTIGDAEKDVMSHRLNRPGLQHADQATLEMSVLAAIRDYGFEGEAAPIVVAGGLIFTLETIEHAEIVRLLVSTQIRWTMGAPGLVHVCGKEGKRYVPCAFIGSWRVLMDPGESVLL